MGQMSESGKVSLPTPERIEEIVFSNGYKIKVKDQKIYFVEPDGLGAAAPADTQFVLELIIALKKEQESMLAALEESRQEGERLNEICKQLAGEEMLFQDGKYETEMQRVQGKLAEAQQTIARQQEVLEFLAADENWSWWGEGEDETVTWVGGTDPQHAAREAQGNKEGSDKA
jgi:hypothetical protein